MPSRKSTLLMVSLIGTTLKLREEKNEKNVSLFLATIFYCIVLYTVSFISSL